MLNAEQSEKRTQWVALDWGTQMCDCFGLKPCQDLLCGVTTLTESVFLHVRTNAGLPDPNRERERKRGGGSKGLSQIHWGRSGQVYGHTVMEVSKECREPLEFK